MIKKLPNTSKKRSTAAYLGQSPAGGNVLKIDLPQNISKSMFHSLPPLRLPLKGTAISPCRPREETAVP